MDRTMRTGGTFGFRSMWGPGLNLGQRLGLYSALARPAQGEPLVKRKKLKLSSEERRDVAALAQAMGSGVDWPFAFEGPAIHHYRSVKCLRGLRYATADAIARMIVAEALKRIGARRPSFEEDGQYKRDYIVTPYSRPPPGQLSDYTCQSCSKVFQARQPAKWCSNRCELRGRNYYTGEEFACEICAKPFRRVVRADKPTPRFCSPSCSVKGQHRDGVKSAATDAKWAGIRQAILDAPKDESAKETALRLGCSVHMVRKWARARVRDAA